MVRTPKEIVQEAAVVRRSFSDKLRALDAKCREIVLGTVRAAEEAKIKEIRARYE